MTGRGGARVTSLSVSRPAADQERLGQEMQAENAKKHAESCEEQAKCLRNPLYPQEILFLPSCGGKEEQGAVVPLLYKHVN